MVDAATKQNSSAGIPPRPALKLDQFGDLTVALAAAMPKRFAASISRWPRRLRSPPRSEVMDAGALWPAIDAHQAILAHARATKQASRASRGRSPERPNVLRRWHDGDCLTGSRGDCNAVKGDRQAWFGKISLPIARTIRGSHSEPWARGPTRLQATRNRPPGRFFAVCAIRRRRPSGAYGRVEIPCIHDLCGWKARNGASPRCLT